LQPSRIGVQTPTHRSVPEYVKSYGQEAIDLAAVGGLYLDEWQQGALRDSMCVDSDGKWAATEVGLIVPRQNGKGSVLEALVLWWLVWGKDILILWSSHEFKTSGEAFLRIKSIVDGTPSLQRRVKSIRTANGSEGITFKNGNRLRFVARSGGSGRGFSGDLIILDEAFALTDAMIASLFPTMSARENPQIWYTSSAPLITSTVLRRLCVRGRKGSPGLTYLEWCASKHDDLDDRDAWAQANPGLGIRLSEEFTEKELAAMDEDDFQRERLGVWLEDEFAAAIDLPTWKRLAIQADSEGATSALAV
jgi:phage terminase large subunit-like protein